METPVKAKRKEKVFESYTSFGPQSPSTKRTAPAYTINAETLIPTSRFMLGKDRDKTPGPDYEKISAMENKLNQTKEMLQVLLESKLTENVCEQNTNLTWDLAVITEQIFHQWGNNLTVEREAIGALSGGVLIKSLSTANTFWRNTNKCLQLMTSTIYCDT